jgi:antitoxin component of RelBE/YafQ-DinJ toxin-antitoxin module
MRLSVKDRKALDEVAEHHGLNCSEIVRVLVFREARLAGLITETQIERGNNETRATGHLNA